MMLPQGNAIIILNPGAQRESGRKAQLANIRASKAIADIVRSTLGPKSMMKMLLDPMGGIVLTNDGNAILREVDVTHPAAKSLIEISRAQDEEVGDGTKSVVILAGEILSVSEPFMEKEIHPIIIVNAFMKGLDLAIKALEDISKPIDINNNADIMKILKSCIGTKFVHQWGDLICNLALTAVQKVARKEEGGKLDIDIKRYAKIEKMPGGSLEESCVLDGVVINKDITHTDMRRKVINPRIILLDATLEYKKGESMTNMELTKEEDFKKALMMEEEEVKRTCEFILKLKPDVVLTEKGISDLAQHYLLKGNVSAIRRIRKTDNNRIARVSGATIVNRPEELTEEDVGKNCKLFEIKKIGDEYFSYFIKSENANACSIILRGGSKDTLNEIERNLQDAMCVARNVMLNPKLVPGGGAAEMHISNILLEESKKVQGVQQWPLQALSTAFEVIPRTIAQNSGTSVVKAITELRALQIKEKEGPYYGIDGNTGKIERMDLANIWDCLSVKLQTIKSSIEVSAMILRIDDIVSGISKKKETSKKPKVEEQPAENETFGDARDG